MRELISAEWRMLRRNAVVLSSAVFLPIFFAVALYLLRDTLGDPGTVFATQSVTIAVVGLYMAGTTTLAARRRSQYLKRMLSLGVGPTAVLVGVLGLLVLLTTMQIGAAAIFLGVVSSPPVAPLVVVAGLVLLLSFLTGAAILTASLTKSAEHAQITTMPLFLVLFGVAVWTALFVTPDTVWLSRAIPGGALTELLTVAWNGGELATLWPSATISLAYSVGALALGVRGFTWDRRGATG
ncbi:ABC transporter permease [Micrococcus luteus]|uniref:ABC transporter permease n=2 Tax=Actinomycetes TaxID=1760 RepID=UPI003D3579C3|nr:hypothetical protein [Kaistella montana]